MFLIIFWFDFRGIGINGAFRRHWSLSVPSYNPQRCDGCIHWIYSFGALISRHSKAVAFSEFSMLRHDHVGHVFPLENPQHDVVFLSSESVSVSVVDQINKCFLSFVMNLTFSILYSRILIDKNDEKNVGGSTGNA